jgi:formylglycine-generating enzyme required for sulfatase activity
LRQDVEWIRTHTLLGEQAARWKARSQAGHADDLLLRGSELSDARAWIARRKDDAPDITDLQRAFLNASEAAEEAAARTWRWLQAAVGVLMLGTIASVLGVIFKDEISDLWFERTTLRLYIATNFTPHVRTPAAERAFKPGDEFRECAKDCPAMVVIPPGEFWMGSPDDEGLDREHPRHKVKIDKPFAVGKFEVTWDDWDACVAMRGCDGKPTGDGGFGKGSHPVIHVSWHQAKAYVDWLKRMTDKPYRLLTEAEWEYAARGVTSADAPHPPYPWGDKASHEYANKGEDQCCLGKSEGRDKWIFTAPVGQFPPNTFGLHDMHGNVWEWVEDPWHDDYRGTPPTDGTAWTEGGDESRRVLRGGAWGGLPQELRSAYRSGRTGTSGDRVNNLGFRIGRTLTAGAGATTVALGAH